MMSLVVSFVATVLFALLEGSHMISVSRATRTVNLTWSANVSSMYPPRYDTIVHANVVAVSLETPSYHSSLTLTQRMHETKLSTRICIKSSKATPQNTP